MLTLADLIRRFHDHNTTLVAAGLLAPATALGHRIHLNKIPADVLSKVATELAPVSLAGVKWSRHFLQSVERLYNWAHSGGLIAVNPIGKLPKPSVGQRERVMTDEEFKLIWRNAPRHFRWFLLLQRHTIMRPGEIRNLRWQDVDLPNRIIRLRKFKCQNRRKDKLRVRLVPLSRVAVCILAKLRRDAAAAPPDAFVIPNRRGKQLTVNAVRIAMHRACERAGIDQSGERLVCYSVRHTAATEATRNGLRDRELADIMGHTTTATTARYQHLNGADLVAAIDRAAARAAQRV